MTNEATIAIITLAGAIVAVLSTSVASIIWFSKYMIKDLNKTIKEHTEASVMQTESNDRVAKTICETGKISQEVLDFMKNLNGKLTKATAQTIEEKQC